MKYKYKIYKVVFDLILFKLKYKDLKLALDVSKLYKNLNLNNLNKIIKFIHLINFDIKKFERIINIHNKYVIGKENKIDVFDFMKVIYDFLISIKSPNTTVINLLKTINDIDNNFHFIKKNYKK